MAPNPRTYFVGFHHGEVGCVLQGHKKGPYMRPEGDSFTLSKKERKGLLLQLTRDSTQFFRNSEVGSHQEGPRKAARTRGKNPQDL